MRLKKGIICCRNLGLFFFLFLFSDQSKPLLMHLGNHHTCETSLQDAFTSNSSLSPRNGPVVNIKETGSAALNPFKCLKRIPKCLMQSARFMVRLHSGFILGIVCVAMDIYMSESFWLGRLAYTVAFVICQAEAWFHVSVSNLDIWLWLSWLRGLHNGQRDTGLNSGCDCPHVEASEPINCLCIKFMLTSINWSSHGWVPHAMYEKKNGRHSQLIIGCVDMSVYATENFTDPLQSSVLF